MTIKSIHYALQAVDSQLFLRLFLDAAKKKPSLLAHLDNSLEPEKPWLGDVNIDKKEFRITRLLKGSKKSSSFAVTGTVDTARNLLMIRLSVSLYEIVTLLVISGVWGFISVKLFGNNLAAYALGPCLFLLQLLFLILDYQKTMQLLENYLPAPVEVAVRGKIQQRRYQK